MFFTQEDYKKIQQWLTKNSVKDTEFNEANIPFNGNEIVSIVQGTQNKKVFLKDLVSQIFNLGVSDFVNITDKYDAPNISLEEAIRLIPSRARKEGQVITFLDREDHWHIYQFKGILNQWNVLDQWEDLFDWEKLIINSILPDEEDLTKSLPDENGNSYLSLKDREYNPEDFSGLGRIILRKNIVEVEDPTYGKVKKNILYQDMINKENTIYEIRYDFDLNGEEITIPKGCVLDFQGGSIFGGKIIFNNTELQGNIKINSNFTGKIKNGELDITWFGAKAETNFDNTIYIQRVINNIAEYGNTMFVPSGIFMFRNSVIVENIPCPTIPSIRGVKSCGVSIDGVYIKPSDPYASVLQFNPSTDTVAIKIKGANGGGFYNKITARGDGEYARKGEIRDVTIVGMWNKRSNNQIGLELSSCLDGHLDNVGIYGFHYGLVTNTAWGLNITSCNFNHNYIGAIFKKCSSATILETNAENNGLMGILINSVTAMDIFRVNLEYQPIGICINRTSTDGCGNINIYNPYFEIITKSVIIVGADETFVDSEYEVMNINIIDMAGSGVTQNSAVYFGNVVGASLKSNYNTVNMYKCSDKAKYINYNSTYSNTGLYEVNKRNGINYRNNYNLIPNGFGETDQLIFYNPTYGSNQGIEYINGVKFFKYWIEGKVGTYQSILASCRVYYDSSSPLFFSGGIRGYCSNGGKVYARVVYGNGMQKSITIIGGENGWHQFIIPSDGLKGYNYFDIIIATTTEGDHTFYCENLVVYNSPLVGYVNSSANESFRNTYEVELTANTPYVVSHNFSTRDYFVQATVVGNNFANVRIIKENQQFQIVSDKDCTICYTLISK